MKVSTELSLFLNEEIINEAMGGDTPATVGSAWDSMQQMPDDVLAEIIEEEEESPRLQEVRDELKTLVDQLGYDHLARELT